MGRMKDAAIQREENLAIAASYLVKKGVLQHCEYHSETYGGGFFELDSEFYKNAMADRNRGVNGPAPWAADMDAREYTDVLKEAYETYAGDGCGRCAKIERE